MSDSPIQIAAPAQRVSRQSRVVWGNRVVTVGGGAPVRVQSMTNTDTVDVIGTAIQVKELALAGSEMVRITVNTPEAAQAVPHIREQLDKMGIDVPLIGDFHYNGHRLLTEYPACAETLSKYRINPGNVGKGDKRDVQFGQMIEVAQKWGKPIRIGVNWGSLDQELLAELMDLNSRRAQPFEGRQVMYEALIQSAIGSAQRAEAMGMDGAQIALSCKVSGVQDLISVYRELARRCDCPLHLGLTEAGLAMCLRVAHHAFAHHDLVGRHGPFGRRGRDQHAARRSAGLAQLHEGVGDRRAAAGALGRAPEQVVVAGAVGRRAFDHHACPVGVQFFGHQCGQSGVGALAHLEVLGDHGDGVVSTDAHEGVGGEAAGSCRAAAGDAWSGASGQEFGWHGGQDEAEGEAGALF